MKSWQVSSTLLEENSFRTSPGTYLSYHTYCSAFWQRPELEFLKATGDYSAVCPPRSLKPKGDSQVLLLHASPYPRIQPAQWYHQILIFCIP